MISKKEALQEMARRELGRRNFQDYIRYTFISSPESKVYLENWHTDLICRSVQRVIDGECKNLIISCPPRHGKTNHIGEYLPPYFLGKNKLGRVAYITNSEKLYSKVGMKVRDVITSKRHENIFGETKIRTDQNAKANWKTETGGQFLGSSVGASIMGEGMDLLIEDDLYSTWADAMSPTISESIWEFHNSLGTRLSPNGARILMFTRYSTDDVIAREIERGGLKKDGGKWEMVYFPAISSKSLPMMEEDPRKEDDLALWEDMYNIEKLEEKKEDLGFRQFSAMYQGDPVGASGTTFPASSFKYFALSDMETGRWKKDDFEVGIFVDPAFSTRTNSDDAVIMAVAKHKQTKEIFILDIQAGTFPPSVSTKLPINMARKWKGSGWNVRLISVEDVSLNPQQTIFCNTVDEEMRKEGAIFILNRYKPKGKKEDRIKYTLEPYFDRGALYFRCDVTKEEKEWRKMEEQFLKFPASPKDDIIDTVTQAVEVMEDYAVTSNVTDIELRRVIHEYEEVGSGSF